MVTLESLGVPTVLIATPSFANGVKLHARVYGLPEYKAVYLDSGTSSIGGFSPEAMEDFSEQLFDQAVAILTGRKDG
jgi:hypothetical protein